jgi:non-specific serine/threonine protein kinase
MTIAPSPPFGTVLRAYRQAAGLSQEALAERAGLSMRAISDLERGRRLRPYPHTVRQLARALRLTSAERVRLEVAGRPPVDAAASDMTGDPPRTNLPAPVTSFIGREREMNDIARQLAATRLLTLTGAGGCGKTRLALQVAAGLIDTYSDGVWLAELAPLTDPTLVSQAVVRALGLQEAAGQDILSRLLSILKPKRLLLVLDNCEHMADACAHLADALLRGCPNVTVLATSREALGIGGEIVWRVPSLALPTASTTAVLPASDDVAAYEAIRLFVERATAVQPQFTLSPLNAPAVVQICRRLDGIPLAIELAAARVRHLTVGQIAARLDNRFGLLTSGGRTALPRQQTLRATIDWSHDLLSDEERVLLRRLAVFTGGCTLEAIETVCAGDERQETDAEGYAVPSGGSPAPHPSTPDPRSLAPTAVLDLLGHLVDRSLVLVDDQGSEARYGLLETMREYGRDRLQEAGELTALRRRHLAWCVTLAEHAERGVEGAEQLTWFARLDDEHDNLRSALAWSLDEDPAMGLRLAGSLWPYWWLRSYYVEGERWLDSLLARTPAPTLPRAKALVGAGVLARSQARKPRARVCLEEGLPLCRALGDRRLLALALRELGYLLPEVGGLNQGRALLDEALALAEADGDKRGLGLTLSMLSMTTALGGDYARARDLGEASLLALRQVGDRWMTGRALDRQGLVALIEGDCLRAQTLWEEALSIAQAVGVPNMMAVLRVRLGWAALWQGDADRAEAHYAAAHALTLRHSIDTSRAHALSGLGRVAQVRGETGRATALLTESLAICTERGAPQGIGEAQYGLGLTARDQGDLARATDWLRQSLAVRQEIDDRPGVTTCFEALATVAAEQGQSVRTARLLGAAEALRQAIRSPMPLVERPAFEAAVQTARATIGQDALDAAWAAGRALPLPQAIAEALADDVPSASSPRVR